MTKKPFKQDPPALKKKEEKFGDQDGDGEAGEAPSHVKKVKAAEKKQKSGFVPFQKGGKSDGKAKTKAKK
jgi:hypothetical protein